MSDQPDRGAQDRIAAARRALDESHKESERIRATLERSRRIRQRALPALRRAGYLR